MQKPLLLEMLQPWITFLATVALPIIAFTKLATSVNHLTDTLKDMKTLLSRGLDRLNAVEQEVARLQGRMQRK